MSESLPPFSGDAVRCAKCGHEGAGTTYRPSGTCLHAEGAVLGFKPNERLCRRCERCGHQWDEALVETGSER